MKIIFIISLICFNFFTVITASEYNVKNNGAVGNGIVLDTESIQKTIDKAYNNGGGIVVVPTGIYKVGTIFLKSNVTLHLQTGATILGSPDIKDYSEISYNMESRTNKLYVKYAVIFAEDAKNIAITGFGIINGNGAENFQITRPQNKRPYLIRLVNCKNIKIKDVQLLKSANWTFHLLGCQDVNIDGIKILNTTENGNRDGLDIDACKNVTVSNSKISSIDDAIVLKSTNNIICENITITNCSLSSHASAIKTGTESNGGFKNITVSNCVIKNIPVHSGIELMTVDGGDLQNITISNIVMDNVATPIFVYLGNRSRPFKKGQYVKKISRVNDIYFDNITITNAKLPSGVIGINNRRVKNISFNNISIKYSETINTVPLKVNAVPHKDLSYPMAIMHGTNLPAYAFYCRNVNGLIFNNIITYSAKGEKRPAFVFDNVSNLELYSVKSGINNFLAPQFYLRNSDNIFSSECRTLNNTKTLFEIEKQNCTDFNFSGNFIQKNQIEVSEIEALSDTELFADINPVEKFNISKGKKVDGLFARKISLSPLSVEFNIDKNVTPQICLLVKNTFEKPEKIKIKYNGIEQTFLIDWNKWGWAPITLTKNFTKNKKVKFEIEPVRKNSGLVISKVYLKNLNLGYTD